MKNQILLSNQRICSMCKTIKLVGEFYRDRQYYTSRCKKCLDVASSENKLQNKKNLSDAYIDAKLIGSFLAAMNRMGKVGYLKHKDVRAGISAEMMHAKRALIKLDNSLKTMK